MQQLDLPGAIRELAPLAEAGEADAQNVLGAAYDYSYEEGGAARARGLFRQAAENGLFLGMLNLARSLQSARAGPPDPAQAIEWLIKAARAGLRPAMVKLADSYRSGIGTAVDKAAAQTWYERAAKLNDAEGMAGLADLLLESSDHVTRASGQQWLENASQAGSAHAQLVFAMEKLLGVGGVARDDAAGVALARSAAKGGAALAAAMLADLYRDGVGVARSEAEALTWYAEAARLGAVRGQVEMARVKLIGGPGHDAALAYFWTEVAARNPGKLQAAITALSEGAKRELTPAQAARARTRADRWQPGMPP